MKKLELLKEIFILTVAIFIIACAVYFFLVPSHAAVSSISGLAIVLSNLIPFAVSEITFVINVSLLVVGIILFGKEFGLKSMYTSVMLPAFLKMFEVILPDFGSMTGDATLDVIAYIFVVSIGLCILFNRNATSGGLDIVAMIMNRYLHMELGKAMSLAGMCIALSSALVYDKKTVVLSVLGTYFNGLLVDYFIFGQNEKKRVCIISQKEEEVRKWILYELHSGATVYEAYGAYNMEMRREIITIVDKNEYQKLMNYMAKTDPDAFMTVYTVKEIKYKPKVFVEK